MLHMFTAQQKAQAKEVLTNAATTVIGAAVGAYMGAPGDTNTELAKTALACVGGANAVKLAINSCQVVKDYAHIDRATATEVLTNAAITAVGAAAGAYLGMSSDTNTELAKTALTCIGGAHIIKLAINTCQLVKDYVSTPAARPAARRR